MVTEKTIIALAIIGSQTIVDLNEYVETDKGKENLKIMKNIVIELKDKLKKLE